MSNFDFADFVSFQRLTGNNSARNSGLAWLAIAESFLEPSSWHDSVRISLSQFGSNGSFRQPDRRNHSYYDTGI